MYELIYVSQQYQHPLIENLCYKYHVYKKADIQNNANSIYMDCVFYTINNNQSIILDDTLTHDISFYINGEQVNHETKQIDIIYPRQEIIYATSSKKNILAYASDEVAININVQAEINNGTQTTYSDELNINLNETIVLDKFKYNDILACVSNTILVEARLKIFLDNNNVVTLTGNDHIKSFIYTDDRYVPDQGWIAQFVARTLECELQDIDEEYIPEDKEVELQLGIIDNERKTLTWYTYGRFIVTKPTENNVDGITKLIAMDYAKKFNLKFNANFTNTTFPISLNTKITQNENYTLLWLAQYTCAQIGVTLGSTDFINHDFVLDSNQFQNNETCRDVMKYIGQLAFSWVRIGWDNKCYLDFNIPENIKTLPIDTIDTNQYFSLEKQKEKYGPINYVAFGLSGIDGETVYDDDPNSIEQNGKTALYFYDNPMLYTYDIRSNAVEKGDILFGLEYLPLSIETIGHPWLIGNEQIIVEDTQGNQHITFPFNKQLIYNGHIRSKIDSSAQTSVEETYGYDNEITKTLNNISFTIDRQNEKITSVINVNSEQSAKISKLTQTVDKLESDITEIADITNSTDGYGAVELSNINESEPIYVKIYPTNNQDISYLYPMDTLYPSDNLFMKDRIVIFHNETTGEDFPYELPNDLLYYDENNYDEFILDYDALTCIVNKKVSYNADGSKYLLEQPTTIPYLYPKIHLTNGDYTVFTPGYENAFLFVRLMVQNLYTDQFATKMELNSSIEQTAKNIKIEVSAEYATKKQLQSAIDVSAKNINISVGEKLEDYSTTKEMNAAIDVRAKGIESTVSEKVDEKEVISKINQSAEDVKVQASKVDVEGVITAINNNTRTTIDGDKITTGSITAEKVSSDIITTTNFSAQEINADNIKSGTISADKINGGTISGSAINLGDGTFGVDTDGKVNASSGLIGGFTIEPEKLSTIDNRVGMHSSTVFSGDPAFYAGGDPWNTTDWANNIPFYVTHNGYLRANNALISGTIYANNGRFSGIVESTEGNIGGWLINEQGITGIGYDATIPDQGGVLLTPAGVHVSSQVSGNVSKSWFKIVSSASDKNVKNNISSLDETYETFFNNLKPVVYKYNKTFDHDDYDKLRFGFIAQDVEENMKENLPEIIYAVYQNEGELYQLDKNEFIALNTWQIQKLKNSFEEMATRVNMLEKRIKELESDKNE